MPKFDGTGPAGQGAQTGRGMGPCGGGRALGRRGLGRGVGRGIGLGYQRLNKGDKLEMLKNEKKELEIDLSEINQELTDVENDK